MAVIQEELEKADVLVVSTPLYWSMVPSELKAVIDRVYQYDPTHGGKHLAIREAVLLACGETENEKDFDMVKNFFRGFAEFNGMCVKHMLAVPKVNQKGDIEGNLSLKEAENIGKSLS